MKIIQIIAVLLLPLLSFADNIAEIKKSAEAGSADAQLLLGNAYRTGSEGIIQNFTTAFEWYSKSAEQSNQIAQYYIYDAFNNGIGVQQNIAAANAILLKLANEGDANSQSRLGLQYYGHVLRFQNQLAETNQLIQANAIQAYYWFSLASSKSSKNQLPALFEARDLVLQILTPMNQQTAQKFASEFKPKPKSPLFVSTDGIRNSTFFTNSAKNIKIQTNVLLFKTTPQQTSP